MFEIQRLRSLANMNLCDSHKHMNLCDSHKPCVRRLLMQMITATHLKQHLGACFERVQTNPLVVERSGRPWQFCCPTRLFRR